jgi:hypothetical protein
LRRGVVGDDDDLEVGGRASFDETANGFDYEGSLRSCDGAGAAAGRDDDRDRRRPLQGVRDPSSAETRRPHLRLDSIVGEQTTHDIDGPFCRDAISRVDAGSRSEHRTETACVIRARAECYIQDLDSVCVRRKAAALPERAY